MVRLSSTYNHNLVRYGLDVLGAARVAGVSVRTETLNATERKLREQMLVGYAPRGADSAPTFWLDVKAREVVVKTLDHLPVVSLGQDGLLRGVIERMPNVRSWPAERTPSIEPGDLVRGFNELRHRMPDVAGWKLMIVYGALATWWGFRKPENIELSIRRGDFLERMYALDSDAASVLGQERQKRAPREYGRRATPGAIIDAALKLKGARPELMGKAYKVVMRAISEEIGLSPNSLVSMVCDDSELLAAVGRINPEARAFIGEPMHPGGKKVCSNEELKQLLWKGLPDQTINQSDHTAVRFALNVIDVVREISANVDNLFLWNLECSLQEQILVGFRSPNLNKPTRFWLPGKLRTFFLQLLGLERVSELLIADPKVSRVMRDLLAQMGDAPRPRFKSAPDMDPIDVVSGLQELLRRAPEARETWKGCTIYFALGRWLECRDRYSLRRALRRESFFDHIKTIDPNLAAILKPSDTAPKLPSRKRTVTSESIVAASRRTIKRMPSLAQATYTDSLVAIGTEMGLRPQSLLSMVGADQGLLEGARQIDPELMSFVREPVNKGPGSSRLQAPTIMNRVRSVREQGFEGILSEKLRAIVGKGYGSEEVLYGRIIRPHFMRKMLRNDPGVAYWLHPLQADFVRMHGDWREAGGELLDPEMTPQDAYLRFRNGEQIVNHDPGMLLLSSNVWRLVDEDAVDLALMNDPDAMPEGIAGAIALYRNMKIMFSGGPVGIIGLTGLAHLLDVSVADIVNELVGDDKILTGRSPVDPQEVVVVYEQLMRDSNHWFERFAGFGKMFGVEYRNMVYEAMYAGAEEVVRNAVDNLSHDEVRVIAGRGMLKFLRKEYWRTRYDIPYESAAPWLMGMGNRHFKQSDAVDAAVNFTPSAAMLVACTGIVAERGSAELIMPSHVYG